MTEKILALVFVFINSVISTTGYAGVVLLMAIESACIPLPSELIMPFAGYLVYQGTFKLLWVATAGAIALGGFALVNAQGIGAAGHGFRGHPELIAMMRSFFDRHLKNAGAK